MFVCCKVQVGVSLPSPAVCLSNALCLVLGMTSFTQLISIHNHDNIGQLWTTRRSKAQVDEVVWSSEKCPESEDQNVMHAFSVLSFSRLITSIQFWLCCFPTAFEVCATLQLLTIGRAALVPVYVPSCPLVSSILSWLYPTCDHLSICGYQDFCSVLETWKLLCLPSPLALRSM